MALLQTLPSTDALSQAAVEGTGRRFEVALGEDATANLFVLRDRVHVYLGTGDTPVAVMRFGSLHSGALWVFDSLIGEFGREPAGSFTVTEIEDGFKRPLPIYDIDPIEYLLERLLDSLEM